MTARTLLAVNASRVVGFLSRGLGKGAGTNFPGRVALRICPDLPERLAGALPYGCVVVTGTNGKTTTSNLLAGMMRASGLTPVHNRSGANLITGITTALAAASSPAGRLRGDIGLFEVDEATLPEALRRLRPSLVVVTNLFRDQLDRYGELESLAGKMNRGLCELKRGTLLLNADDPLVSTLGEGTGLEVRYFGIEDAAAGREILQHAADSKHCRACGEPLRFNSVYFGHMGDYRCDACGNARPPIDFSARRLEMHGIEGTSVDVEGWGDPLRLEVRLPGLYNVYNVLAASGAAHLLDLDRDGAVKGIEGYSTVFGRAEWIEAEGRRVFLILSKNPTGFNEVIRTVAGDGREGKNLLLALNDLAADGRDVSWIWDVDFEELVPQAATVTVTGVRAEDMALRMKYAGMPAGEITLEGDVSCALDVCLERVPVGGTLYALTTYTATLALRKVMTARGYVKGYWEE